MLGFGKVFYYFGKGLWIFGKLLGRGIKRAYYEHQARQRVVNEQRQFYTEIERENYYAGRGYAQGVADVRERERLKRQNEREQKQYYNNLNKMFEVPQVNGNAFFPDAPKSKKKKRSMFDL